MSGEALGTDEPVRAAGTGGSSSVGASAGVPVFGGNPGQAAGGSVRRPGEGGAGGVPRTDFSFALWPMPNAVSSGLPNPASYDTSVPGVVLDQVTGLM